MSWWRYSRPVPEPAAGTFIVTCLPLPASAIGIPLDVCIQQRDNAIAAFNNAINSSKSYHVGSRGLERYSIQDYLDAIKFWTNAANDALAGAYGSSIQSRRAVPCDL